MVFSFFFYICVLVLPFYHAKYRKKKKFIKRETSTLPYGDDSSSVSAPGVLKTSRLVAHLRSSVKISKVCFPELALHFYSTDS